MRLHREKDLERPDIQIESFVDAGGDKIGKSENKMGRRQSRGSKLTSLSEEFENR